VVEESCAWPGKSLGALLPRPFVRLVMVVAKVGLGLEPVEESAAVAGEY
jgi:hypothetical protein